MIRKLRKKLWGKYKIITIAALFALLLPLSVGAIYLFKSLNAKDGLTNSQINCILKDSRGYMWFGTAAGLYRYDGYTFRNFECDSKDGSSLPDSYIKNIYEGLEGELWIETASGYTVYNPQTESFDRNMTNVYSKMGVSDEPTIVYIDKRKNLWMYIPQKGVECYNLPQQLLYEFGYTADSHGIPEGDICSIGECKEGTILVYNDGRIVCVDTRGQQRTVWQSDYIAKEKLRSNIQLKVFADQQDNIWMYGPSTLFFYDKKNDKWYTDFGEKLGMDGTSTDLSINGMSSDRDGNIWIATDRNGLLKMNVSDHTFEHITPQSLGNEEVNTNNIQSIYVDDNGLLWVGTAKHGIAYWGENIYKFDVNTIGDVSTICQDSNGKIWYGTSDDGIIGFNGKLASRKVTSMAFTKDGSMWVGSMQNGLSRIKDGKTKIYSVMTDSMTTVIDDHINALTTDNSGNLWIATNGGLQVYNTTMDAFSSYTKENGKLQSNNITSLYYAKGNRLLAGTSNGIIIMHLSNHDVEYYSGNKTNIKTFTNNYITQIYEDSKKLIWVGTREGLNIMDLSNDSLYTITEKNGLCNNSICGIAEDKNKNVWVTTSNGVCRIVIQNSPEDNSLLFSLNNYNTSDGLQSNEFNNGSIITTQNGQVQMGGIFGINWVRNDIIAKKESLPKVILSQLFIGDNEILVGQKYDGKTILPIALNESDKLNLSNTQNTFTIKFAAGNYNQCERLQYIYWMDGYNNNWQNCDALLHGVSFENLKSGNYILHVKAVNANGAISKEERVLYIIISSPWWMSWWMITIYIILSIFMLITIRYSFKRISYIWSRKKEIITTLELQKKEVKDTSNELRQPMARISSIITNLSKLEISVEGREQLSALHFQMMQLITHITKMQTMLEEAERKANEKINPDMDENGNIKLPEAAIRELPVDINSGKDIISPTKRYIVVLIDDNKDFLTFIKERLDNIYTFSTYNDINDAAKELYDKHPDLVICKQNMDSMTGSELCNKMKQDMRTERCKFVLLTDKVMTLNEMTTSGITLSADECIAKPFNVKDAVRCFNKLLGVKDEDIKQIESHFITADNVTDFVNVEEVKVEPQQDDTEQQVESEEVEKTNEVSTNEPQNVENNVEVIQPVETILPSDNEPQNDIKTNETEKDKETEQSVEVLIPNSGKEIILKKSEKRKIAIRQKKEKVNTENANINEATVLNEEEQEKPIKQEEPVKQEEPTIHEEVAEQEKAEITEGTSVNENSILNNHQDGNSTSMLDLMDRQLLINIEQYVMQNMSRGALSLDEMSAAMGMGRVPFFHKIRAITGKTPAILVRDLRLKRACELLVHSTMDVGEIALDLGFMTPENFIHYFKDKYGSLPLEYRLRHKKDL